MTMLRRRVAPALPVVMALAAVGLFSASAAAAPEGCAALRGADLYPSNAALKVVAQRGHRPDHEAGGTLPVTRYRACSGRTGRVRTVATGGEHGGLFFVVQRGPSSGRYFVLTRSGGGDSGPFNTVATRVYDARTGRSYRVLGYRGTAVGGFRVQDLVIDRHGRSAALVATPARQDGDELLDMPDLPAGATRFVAAFSARGARTVLDAGGAEIAANSLELSRGVLRWTHSGTSQTALLGARTCPSQDLTATRSDGATTSSVGARLVRTNGTGCAVARRVALTAARQLLAGDLGTTAEDFVLSATPPCTGCAPVTSVVARRGAARVTFELRGGV